MMMLGVGVRVMVLGSGCEGCKCDGVRDVSVMVLRVWC